MTMTRLDALKTLMLARDVIANDWKQPIGTSEALDMAIEALKREQAAEWIQPTNSEDCRHLNIRFIRCSKCGEQQMVVGHKGYNELPFNYCPNCRAKMSLQKRAEFTQSYSCDPDDYGTMCEWCEYNDGSKCIKPMKGGDDE